LVESESPIGTVGGGRSHRVPHFEAVSTKSSKSTEIEVRQAGCKATFSNSASSFGRLGGDGRPPYIHGPLWATIASTNLRPGCRFTNYWAQQDVSAPAKRRPISGAVTRFNTGGARTPRPSSWASATDVPGETRPPYANIAYGPIYFTYERGVGRGYGPVFTPLRAEGARRPVKRIDGVEVVDVIARRARGWIHRPVVVPWEGG